MPTHVIVSHGSNFEGVDQFTVKQLRELGQHVRGVLPYADAPPLTRVLENAGDECTFDTDEAALLAVLLKRAAAHRSLKKAHAGVAAMLGIAAACAVTDGEPWTWTPHTEGQP
ncbi:hypothetical protein PV755_45740 [Streptomyces caniscabiei]|uniref:DUF7739 domain-containing protein n=1 Tax=Streptomyces caniscabiei TaxID=2746961 RepID=UPI0029A6551A|nr:hypothetical protein [Streptomyces caniscabiei]MDX3516119.1 hypothetical protein [Streptomyces caniscabiei]